ncbi:MAG: riboflavin biosynthesis protein RibD [Candidatus Eisenbacteria bacterium RBG_16_71_46]|nr:MAG: riboflavin biosynthesis protein RibD [Candidatus Eisenbacteria bacterium RBG_16_71_46]
MAPPSDDDDSRFMRRALRLAERGRGRTHPNPMVGAVVARAGRVVGEGWHRAIGLDHAEVEALARAGARARGATMYVTLEPCAHTGRTPPCVEALERAGIARCVVALRDPHRIVNGRGIRSLRRAGIRVDVGVGADEARDLLGGYWLAHTRRRPRVTWKVAATLDGRIADRAGRSRWITGPEARAHGHRLRATADAVLIGSGTARADDPRLTARAVGAARQPLRVVCDSALELPLTLRLFGAALARGTVVACGPSAPLRRRRALEARGVTVWPLPLRAGRVSPAALARRLAREGRYEVLLEGGATLGTAWLRAGLVDRVALFTAPRLLGADGLAWCGALGVGSLRRARAGRIVQQRRLGADGFLLVDLAAREPGVGMGSAG